MATRIIFNGQEYSSPEEMPPEVRRAYEQIKALLPGAGGGLLGALKGLGGVKVRLDAGRGPGEAGVQITTSSDPAELPPEARELVEKAMSAMEQGRAPESGITVRTEQIVDIRTDGAVPGALRRPPAAGRALPAAPSGAGRAERLLLLALAVLIGLGLVLALLWLALRGEG